MPHNDIPPVRTFSPAHENPASEVSPPLQNPPLGVGLIFRDTFSTLLRHTLPILAIGFVAAGASLLAYKLLGPFKLQIELPSVILARIILYTVPQIAIYAAIAAFAVRLSYDAKLGRPISIKSHILPTITSAFLLTILGAVVTAILLGPMFLTLYFGVISTVEAIILFRAGFGLLFWLSAPISFVVAILVIEQRAMGGFGRSLALTKNYRWAAAGGLYLAAVCLLLFRASYIILLGWLAESGGLSAIKLLGYVFDGLCVVIFSIFITLIYARLREIKEGVGIDRIETVFD